MWVKTQHSHCSTQFEKRMQTGVYSPHSVLVNQVPHHIKSLCPQQRSASSDDDDSEESSETELNVPLFFRAEPDGLSAELDKTDSEDDYNEAKRTQLEKRWTYPIQLYVEAHDEGDCHLHVIYVTRRSRSVEDNLFHKAK